MHRGDGGTRRLAMARRFQEAEDTRDAGFAGGVVTELWIVQLD